MRYSLQIKLLKNRNLLLVKNWRPIILLNADYKLYSKIIATRLKNVLPTLIHTDQSGFMAGRNITQNIRKTSDTIQIARQQKIDELLISIDFEKAFDQIKYSSLYKA